MKQIAIVIMLFFTYVSVFAQNQNFKEQAIEQFKNENYTLAISLMEKALQENPKDAEVYYYLVFLLTIMHTTADLYKDIILIILKKYYNILIKH